MSYTDMSHTYTDTSRREALKPATSVAQKHASTVLQYIAVVCSALQCVAVPAEERAKMLGPACQKRTKLTCRDTAVAVCVCVCVCSSASAESSVDKTFLGPFGSLRIRTGLAHHRLRNLLLKHSMLRCVAVRCSALQCVAVCCSELQCVAVCCGELQCAAV